MERPSGLIKTGGGLQTPRVELAELLHEIREYYERVNICNRSKLLQDIFKNQSLSVTLTILCYKKENMASIVH